MKAAIGPVALALALPWLLFAATAQAAAPDRCQAERLCQEQTSIGAQLASQTRYEEALAIYQSAYDHSQEPRLLVNIGRCHYRLGRARRALEFYDAFRKAEPEPEPELATRVSQFISEARQAIASDAEHPKLPNPAENPKNPPNPAENPKNPPNPAENPPPAPTPVPEPAPVRLEPAPKAPGRLIWGRPAWRVGLGFAALGLGGVLVGLGAGALSVNGQCVTPSETSPGFCATQTLADGQTGVSLFDGVRVGAPLVATGGVLAVAGIVLLALPGR